MRSDQRRQMCREQQEAFFCILNYSGSVQFRLAESHWRATHAASPSPLNRLEQTSSRLPLRRSYLRNRRPGRKFFHYHGRSSRAAWAQILSAILMAKKRHRKPFASQPLRPAPPGAEGGHFIAGPPVNLQCKRAVLLASIVSPSFALAKIPRRQQNLECVKPPVTYEALAEGLTLASSVHSWLVAFATLRCICGKIAKACCATATAHGAATLLLNNRIFLQKQAGQHHHYP